MAHGLLREAGYHLAPNLGPPTLQQSLCATWPREVLAMRNGHVARELVQRAISARNGSAPPTADAPRFSLDSFSDFAPPLKC